jgi:DNA polymerase
LALEPEEEGGMIPIDRRSAALLAETDFLLGLDASPALELPASAALPADPDRAAALDRLRLRHDAECPHCTVATAHTQTVFGEGSPAGRLMFVGEAPGEAEDRLGRPFVGPAGEKLYEMVRAMGLSREEVYVANVLKSRPPENRTPLEPEIAACGSYLEEQIRIIRPEIIVALGSPAAKFLLRTDEGITRLRGVWGELRLATLVPGETLAIPVMPTFHPAYLLRNYTPETRRAVWSDLQQVAGRLGADSR